MQDSSANIISLSKAESKKFKRFRELSKKADNFYSFNLINGKERAKNDKKNIENESFYDKYEHLSNYSGPDVFELEKELAKYVKFGIRKTWFTKLINYFRMIFLMKKMFYRMF